MEDFNSKYTGEEVEFFLDQIANGEIGGGVTTETDPIFSASPAASITEEKKAEWDNKVDKVSGKQLSTEDFTSTLKKKLEGLNNYDDTELSNALSTLRSDFDKLVSGDTTEAIKTFNEVIAFLNGIQDTQDLSSIIAGIQQQIANVSNAIPTRTSQLTNDSGFLTEHQDISHLATKEGVAAELKKKQDVIMDLHEIREGASKGATAIQEHQDISHLAEKSEVEEVAEDVTKHGQDIVALQALAQEQGALVQESKSRLDVLEPDVTELKGEVETLTGNGEGSVVDIASKEVAKVIDSAPETMDTLKKIADLIEKDAEQAADILATLGGHENRIGTLEDKFVVMSEADYDALPNKEDKFYFCYDE